MKLTVALCVLVSAAAVCARLTHTDDKAEAIELLKSLLAEYDRKEADGNENFDLEIPALGDGEHVETQREGQQGNEQKEDRYAYIGPGGVSGVGPGVVARPPSGPLGNRPLSVSGVGTGLVGNRPPSGPLGNRPSSVSGVGPGVVGNRPPSGPLGNRPYAVVGPGVQAGNRPVPYGVVGSGVQVAVPYAVVGPQVGQYMKPDGTVGYIYARSEGGERSERVSDQENDEKVNDNEANMMEDKSSHRQTILDARRHHHPHHHHHHHHHHDDTHHTDMDSSPELAQSEDETTGSEDDRKDRSRSRRS